ncbi:MAG: hypothetical protein NUV32_10625 [Exilispira sp.]|jgi:hypothetical protein|nr:hypothetical protein [Exilispira sp.]
MLTSEDSVFLDLATLRKEELIRVNGEGYTDPFSLDNMYNLIVDDPIIPRDLWADYNTYNNTWTVHWADGTISILTNSEFHKLLQWIYD